MEPEPVAGAAGLHAVDTELLGLPELMSAYLLEGPDGVAVVDPGAAPAADRVLAAVDALGYDPADVTHLLPTHVHLDHAGATGALAAACPEATVAVHERGLPYLTERAALDRLVESARAAMGAVADGYGDPELVPADRCRTVGGGETVDVAGRALSVVDAPGHAPHQYCLLDDRSGALLAADAAGMFVAGELYPTTPPPDFDLDASLATVDRLLEADPELLCYAHFGARNDAVAALEAYRDLLPAWVAAAREALAAADEPPGAADHLDPRWHGPTVERDLAGVAASLDGG
jgi:glyoxylase-like metal-dependent hydrolase (beta-lactamase superfamily II)